MTFQIDWPPGFVSRTGDPADPCFVGRLGDTKGRSHRPAAASIDKFGGDSRQSGGKPAHRLRVGTSAHKVWLYIKANGPQSCSQMQIALGLTQTQVFKPARKMVNNHVLKRSEGLKATLYSLGDGPVVEVQ